MPYDERPMCPNLNHRRRATMLRTTMLLAIVVTATPSLVHAQKFLKKDVGGWVQDLGNAANESGRRNAAFALGKMGEFAVDAVPALRRTLQTDPSPKVRDAAAYALGEIARRETKTAAD